MSNYNESLILIFTLGIVGIIINLYTLLKVDKEFNGRVLGKDQILLSFDDWANSDSIRDYMTKYINETIGSDLNFIEYNKDYYMSVEKDNKKKLIRYSERSINNENTVIFGTSDSSPYVDDLLQFKLKAI